MMTSDYEDHERGYGFWRSDVGTSLFGNLIDDLFGGFVDVLFLVAFLSGVKLSAIFMK